VVVNNSVAILASNARSYNSVPNALMILVLFDHVKGLHSLSYFAIITQIIGKESYKEK
jgi:hypothetical protein